MEATHGAACVTGGRRRPGLAPGAVREARGVAEIGREQEGWRQAGAAGSSVWGAARAGGGAGKAVQAEAEGPWEEPGRVCDDRQRPEGLDHPNGPGMVSLGSQEGRSDFHLGHDAPPCSSLNAVAPVAVAGPRAPACCLSEERGLRNLLAWRRPGPPLPGTLGRPEMSL